METTEKLLVEHQIIERALNRLAKQMRSCKSVKYKAMLAELHRKELINYRKISRKIEAIAA